MKIVLLGFMCAGKTKVGKILSKKLAWPHYDTDEMLEKQAGCTVAELIRTHGEDIFRDIERQIVEEVSGHDQCIISTGGGVPLDPVNMLNLKRRSVTFWLKVLPKTVMARAGDLKKRPLIDPQAPFDSICNLLQKRRPFYAVADHTIETDLLKPDEVAEKIVPLLPKSKE